jgi:hypothetical protein
VVEYLLVLILALGVPFLLYCLWNFARELKPRKSTAGAPFISSRWGTVPAIRTLRLKSRPPVVQLRDQGRTAS